jgi:microcystin-dependent protein
MGRAFMSNLGITQGETRSRFAGGTMPHNPCHRGAGATIATETPTPASIDAAHLSDRELVKRTNAGLAKALSSSAAGMAGGPQHREYRSCRRKRRQVGDRSLVVNSARAPEPRQPEVWEDD